MESAAQEQFTAKDAIPKLNEARRRWPRSNNQKIAERTRLQRMQMNRNPPEVSSSAKKQPITTTAIINCKRVNRRRVNRMLQLFLTFSWHV
jgi:hypothetical protein